MRLVLWSRTSLLAVPEPALSRFQMQGCHGAAALAPQSGNVQHRCHFILVGHRQEVGQARLHVRGRDKIRAAQPHIIIWLEVGPWQGPVDRVSHACSLAAVSSNGNGNGVVSSKVAATAEPSRQTRAYTAFSWRKRKDTGQHCRGHQPALSRRFPS